MFSIKKIIKDINLGGKPSDHKIAVAMSGGVDSSVTAAMLKECGYNVIGLSMHLYNQKISINSKKTCCAGLDLKDARSVADKLNFPHYVLNYSTKFNNQVINDFADSYLKGETPIPCVRCNQTVKFIDMYYYAKKLGASALATGHYIRRKMINNFPQMYRAVDLSKDQSYFLFATTSEQLHFLRFPLGEFNKSETRKLALKYNLNVADKPDSQDICFVPQGKYSDFLRKLRPNSILPGDILHVDGTKIGKHNGIIDYTVGQRKGITIGGRKGIPEDEAKLYVVRIDQERNNIIVGPRRHLMCKTIELKDCNWIYEKNYNLSDVLVKLRNTSSLILAKVKINKDSCICKVVLDKPEHGISPGQAVVFYNIRDKNHVLGGGWINRTSLQNTN